MVEAASETSAFAVRMIFLRVGWMNRYRGQTGNDHIAGGGAFVEEHGYGHEIYNFEPFEGKVYGYVQPPRSGYNQPHGPGIKIERLGGSAGDDSISGVLAIWVATSPQGGSYVVGWYRNATVFRHWQPPPPHANRHYDGQDLGYYVCSPVEDAVLLHPDERLLQVPRGESGMGQANVWYADDPNQHKHIRQAVISFIADRTIPSVEQGSFSETDPFLRPKVEQAAIAKTTEYYSQLGYTVASVEGDNVGWDLSAFYGQKHLKLEVKGLSAMEVLVELTPNEYNKMQEHLDTYRLCVVTEALTSPRLAVFAYSKDSQQWEDWDGRVLAVHEVVSARCSVGI